MGLRCGSLTHALPRLLPQPPFVMDEKTAAPQHIVAASEQDAHTDKTPTQPVTAQWRVDDAVKTRWSAITSNPKIILIALLAS